MGDKKGEKAKVSVTPKVRTLVEAARLVEKLEAKLSKVDDELAAIQVELDAARKRLRDLVDEEPPT